MSLNRKMSRNEQQLSRSIRYSTVANRRKKITEVFGETQEQIQNKDQTMSHSDFKQQLKEMNVPLSEKVVLIKKLNHKNIERLNTSISYKKSILSEMNLRLIRLKQLITIIISRDLWRSHMRTIHRQYGSHTAYYFYLFRWFFYFNVLGSVLTLFFLIVPQITYDLKEDISLVRGIKKDILKDCFENENGFIKKLTHFFTENSILYYGHYTSSSWSSGMPYAYLFVNGVYIVLNLILIAYKLGANYSKNYIREQTAIKAPHKVFAYRIFCSWEYTMSSSTSVQLQQKQMLYDIQHKLEVLEPKSSKSAINALKFASILLSLATTVAICCFMILIYHKSIDIKWVNKSEDTNLKSISQVVNGILDSQFGVPLIITLSMFLYNDILNQILKKILDSQSNYSERSPKFIQMLKKILLFIGMTATLGIIYLNPGFNKLYNYNFTTTSTNTWIESNDTINSTIKTNLTKTYSIENNLENRTCGENNTIIIRSGSCWENRFALDMNNYLLVYLGFMGLSLILREWLPAILLCKRQPFDSSRNAFDLIYIQMLCWLTTFYSPFAPILTSIIFVVIFYVKRISIAVVHSPKVQKRKTINLEIWIYVSLLIGLIVCSLPPLFTIFNVESSASCGPFHDVTKYYELISKEINDLQSGEAKELFNSLLSKTSSVFFILFLCVIVHYMRATSNARKHLVQLSHQQVIKNESENLMLTKTLVKFKSMAEMDENDRL